MRFLVVLGLAVGPAFGAGACSSSLETTSPAQAARPARSPRATGRCEPSELKGEAEYSVMARERIGKLRIGMSDKAVRALIGDPDLGLPQSYLEQVSGGWERQWRYRARGLEIVLFSDQPKGPASVLTIFVTAPATLTTRFGIGIGSSRAEVLRAYGPCASEKGNPGLLVAGSIYGGVAFAFHKDRVKTILVGAGAAQ